MMYLMFQSWTLCVMCNVLMFPSEFVVNFWIVRSFSKVYQRLQSKILKALFMQVIMQLFNGML